MSAQRHEESVAKMNSALANWDWVGAEKAAHLLDSSDEATEEGTSAMDVLKKAREWVESASADQSLLPEECERWNPYKPAYIAYTPQGTVVWRCTHSKAEGDGPHEIEVSS